MNKLIQVEGANPSDTFYKTPASPAYLGIPDHTDKGIHCPDWGWRDKHRDDSRAPHRGRSAGSLGLDQSHQHLLDRHQHPGDQKNISFIQQHILSVRQ